MPPSLLQLRDWANRHMPEVALLLVVAWGVVSFLAGRFSAPTKTVTQTVDKTVYQDRIVEKRVEVQAEAKTQERVVYRDRTVITHADGSSEKRDIERTDSGKTDSTVDATSQVHEQVRVEYRDREVTKTVETARPRLRLGVLAGVQPLRLTAPVAWGAEAQVRVLGPAWAGAWALTSGVAGLGVAVEF